MRNLANEVATVSVSGSAILALIETNVVKVAGKAVSQASKSEVSAVFSSPYPSRSDRSASRSKRDSSKASRKTSRKIRHRHKVSRASSAADPRSLGTPSNGSDLSRRRVKVEDVPKLSVLSVKDSRHRSVVNYQT